MLLSGSGSNFAAIAAAARDGSLPIEVRAAVSDRPAAYGLERARALGIPAEAVPVRDFPDRAAHDTALAARIDAYAPALVVCAGYMRIFTPAFVARYADRMLNIHPSLLPAYRGLDTHRRALADGARWHGCSVHFVSDELDGGPLVAQAPVPVLPSDTEATLSARVHRAEHRLYPMVIGWFARGRLRCQGGRAALDGVPLSGPVRVEGLYGEV
ncbi:MAG: phosphoribosylglycinamide formyltransferase [Proteobacteria bacterium]|nr:phosphoribosylglycinamide formyltransferase [Pseudomonadota bacterium]